MTMQLAIDGGRPVRTESLPSYESARGRRLGDEEKDALVRVVDSGCLWRVGGEQVDLLELEFATLIGADHAVASTSGTAALHLAVAGLNPEPGDEIVIPPITDFGTAIAVIAANAVPIFADVDPLTGCITAESVARVLTPRTKAVIVVHLFGGAADVDAIVALCHDRGIRVIEDCAQAYLTVPPGGSSFAGTRGDIGCFSLQQSKHFTAGDGGLTVTNDAELARRMQLFADKGWPRKEGVRTNLFFGMNYRMNELTGAVARVQLGRLPGVVKDRRAIGRRLSDGLSGLEGVALTSNIDPSKHSFWFFPVLLDPELLGVDNATFAAAMVAEGVLASGYLSGPLYAVPALMEAQTFGSSGFPIRPEEPGAPRYAMGDCPVAERLILRDLLVLPCNENMSSSDVDDILAAFHKVHGAFLERRQRS